MQDLTSQFNPAGSPLGLLAPSSQEGGNIIQPSLAKNTMTAPGSEPVSPLPPPVDGLNPVPEPSGPQMPVSHPGNKPRVPAGTSPGGQWADINRAPGVLWKQTK